MQPKTIIMNKTMIVAPLVNHSTTPPLLCKHAATIVLLHDIDDNHLFSQKPYLHKLAS
jgi:hypothetical protein